MDIDDWKVLLEKIPKDRAKILLVGDQYQSKAEYAYDILTLGNFINTSNFNVGPMRIMEGALTGGQSCSFLILDSFDKTDTWYENIKNYFSLQSKDKNLFCMMISHRSLENQSRIKTILELATQLKFFTKIILIINSIEISQLDEIVHHYLKSRLSDLFIIPNSNHREFLQIILTHCSLRKKAKSKKRKNIFKIVKVGKRKKLKRQVIMEQQNSDDDDSNKDNKIPSHDKDRDFFSKNPKSLISISREVKRFFKERKSTKGSEVTQYIIEILADLNMKLSFKNIQRRVYDAINVMTAIGLLSKEKNNLVYKGEKHQNDERIVSKQIQLTSSKIYQKQNELISSVVDTYFFKKFIALNKNEIPRKVSQDKLSFPFFIVKQVSDAAFLIKQDDFNNRVAIFSDKEIKLIHRDEIAKFFLKNDIKKIEAFLVNYVQQDISEYIIKNGVLEQYFSDFKDAQPYQLLPYLNENNFTPNYIIDHNFNNCSNVDNFHHSEMIPRQESQHMEEFMQLESFQQCGFEFNERLFDINENGMNHMSTNFFSKT